MMTKGVFASGDIWLKQGGASWQGESKQHQLSVDNLTAHVTKEGAGSLPSRIRAHHHGRQITAARRADAGMDA